MNLVVESEPRRKKSNIPSKLSFPELQKSVYHSLKEIEEAKARIKYNKEQFRKFQASVDQNEAPESPLNETRKVDLKSCMVS